LVAKAAMGEAVPALRHEADVLTAIDHPGVVRITETSQTAESLVVWTRYAGFHTLRSSPPPGLSGAITCCGQIMATLAHLHSRGLAHRRLDAGHFIVGPRGEVVLCSLRLAGPADAAHQRLDVAHAAHHGVALIKRALASGGQRLHRSHRRIGEQCLQALDEHERCARDLALTLAEHLARIRSSTAIR